MSGARNTPRGLFGRGVPPGYGGGLRIRRGGRGGGSRRGRRRGRRGRRSRGRRGRRCGPTSTEYI